MTKAKSYWKFILKKRHFILWGLLLFVVLAIFVGFTNQEVAEGETPNFFQELSWWADWIDPIIGLGIFIVTLLIGAIQLIEDWEDNLEKRLTVFFIYGENPVMICENAFLSSESDVRALGQQIGSQMAGTRDLKFRPFNIRYSAPKAQKGEYGGFFLFYQVKFYLNDIKNITQLEQQFNTNCKYWKVMDDGKLTMNLEKKDYWISQEKAKEILKYYTTY